MPTRSEERILVLDPGERVGWNTATVQPDGTLEILDYGILPVKVAALALHGVDRSVGPLWCASGEASNGAGVFHFNRLIYETWILTRTGAAVSVGSDMVSSQFVGILRLAKWLHPNAVALTPQPPKDMSTGRLALRNADRIPEYGRIADIIERAPGSHDDSHYVSSLLHTVKYHFKNYA